VHKIPQWDVKQMLERIISPEYIVSARIRPMNAKNVCIVIDVELTSSALCNVMINKINGMEITFAGVPGSFKLRATLPPLDPNHDFKLLKATLDKTRQVVLLQNLPARWFTDTTSSTAPSSSSSSSPSIQNMRSILEANYGPIRNIEIDYDASTIEKSMVFNVAIHFSTQEVLHKALEALCGRIVIRTDTKARASYVIGIGGVEYFEPLNIRKRKFERERREEARKKEEDDRKKREVEEAKRRQAEEDERRRVEEERAKKRSRRKT